MADLSEAAAKHLDDIAERLATIQAILDSPRPDDIAWVIDFFMAMEGMADYWAAVCREIRR